MVIIHLFTMLILSRRTAASSEFFAFLPASPSLSICSGEDPELLLLVPLPDVGWTTHRSGTLRRPGTSSGVRQGDTDGGVEIRDVSIRFSCSYGRDAAAVMSYGV